MLYPNKDITINTEARSSELETEYDKYFNGGLLSTYRKRFGKRLVIPNEEKIITEAFKYVAENATKNKFTILDFGCGDGRLYNLLESFNKQLNSNIKTLEIICYDPSINGIELLKNLLLKKKYLLDYCFDEIKSSGYIKYKLSKNNIYVIIIHANANDNCKKIKNLLGTNVNLAILMFGVLSHIIGRNNRKNILATIRTCLNPEVVPKNRTGS